MGPKLHKWILVGFLDSIFRTSALEGPRGSHGFRTISMLRTSGSVICNPDLWVQTDTSNFLLDISTWYHIDILNLTPENIKKPKSELLNLPTTNSFFNTTLPISVNGPAHPKLLKAESWGQLWYYLLSQTVRKSCELYLQNTNPSASFQATTFIHAASLSLELLLRVS